MKKKISVTTGLIAIVIIVAAIAISIRLQFGTQMSVFVGAVISAGIALILKSKWEDIQKESIQFIADCGMALLILALVGILVGTWLIGGSLPTLIFYGLKLISPKAIVPLTFALCALTSVFTGTSYGSIATMGLAMFGIGINLGIPAAVMAGAVVSGAYFGDKMSPMSDTTNLAPAMSGTDLYSHIGSMLYTTVPATIVTLVIYIFIGLKYAKSAFDDSSVKMMMNTLSEGFNINPICLIPLALVLILAILKVPSILAMGVTAIISFALAVITQSVDLSEVMTAALRGYVSDTGVALVDTILSRGGIVSMMGTISIIFFSGIMAGALKTCGVLDVFEDFLMKIVKSSRSLIISTLIFGWAMVALTGNQMMGIVIPGNTMRDLFDKFNVNRKVLSRSLEDSATIGSAIIPWSAGFAYIVGILGIGTEFIPFACLCYIVPVFSIICAITNIGVWNSDGTPRWAKKKELSV